MGSNPWDQANKDWSFRRDNLHQGILRYGIGFSDQAHGGCLVILSFSRKSGDLVFRGERGPTACRRGRLHSSLTLHAAIHRAMLREGVDSASRKREIA